MTGVVVDSNGTPYQNGSGKVQLVPGNQQWLVNGTNPVNTPIAIGQLDSFGHFSVQLTNTSLITPQGPNPQWQFCFNSSLAVANPPLGFCMAPLSLTSSQDISALIPAQAVILPRPGAVGTLNTILSPSGPTVLGTGTFPTTFTAGDFGVSPVTGTFNITDTSSSVTDTSYNLNVAVPTGSYHNPFVASVGPNNAFAICNTNGATHTSIVVAGAGILCQNLTVSPLSKMWALAATSNHTALTVYDFATGYTANLLQLFARTVSSANYNFFATCASASNVDGSCSPTITTLRGDGLFTTPNINFTTGLTGGASPPTACNGTNSCIALNTSSGSVTPVSGQNTIRFVGSNLLCSINGGVETSCSGGSGTINNATAAANAYYAAAGTTISPDTSIVDNGTGTMTFGTVGGNTGNITFNGTTSGSVSLTTPVTGGALNLNGGLNFTGASGTATTIGTTTSNANLLISPNGTGLVTFNTGTATNPAFNFAAHASNTGIYASGPAAFAFTITGGAKLQILASGPILADTASYGFSQTASATGTLGANLSVVGSGTTEYLNSSTPIIDGGKCQVNALSISNSATTICTFTLPNAATATRIDCSFAYAESSTTTLALDYQFAQAPTNVSMSAEIKTSNTNAATEATITTAGTTANTILTGGTPGATGTFLANVFGTFTSAAATGTLIIHGTAGAASAITISGGCFVH